MCRSVRRARQLDSSHCRCASRQTLIAPPTPELAASRSRQSPRRTSRSCREASLHWRREPNSRSGIWKLSVCRTVTVPPPAPVDGNGSPRISVSTQRRTSSSPTVSRTMFTPRGLPSAPTSTSTTISPERSGRTIERRS